MSTSETKIKFNFNKQKAIETILYFLNVAHKKTLTVMHLLKFLYYADKYHLEKYDRPILGDVYYAMGNGPVASNVYDMLKKSCDDYKSTGWGKNSKVTACRDANLDYFSDTDIEAFNFVIDKYKDFDAEQLSKESHLTKAWQNAWKKKKIYALRSEMAYEDFYDNINPGKIEFLKENASLMVF